MQEVLIAQEADALRVVEVDETLAIGQCELEYLVLAQECDQIAAIDLLLGRPIQPHERRVRRELAIGVAETLSQVLRLQLALHDLYQRIAEHAFRMNRQHFLFLDDYLFLF